MPNKKQSARPAESGWLMATALLSLPALRIGVERFKLTLSELEELCRHEADCEMMTQGHKGTLPWRSDIVLSAGIGKGPDDREDDSEWYRLEGLCERFTSEMEAEEKRRARKGKDGSGNPRKSYASWILPSEHLRVIFGKSESEYRWKLLKSLKSKSEILGSALSEKSKGATSEALEGLGLIIDFSRVINRNRRAEVLREIAWRQKEIDEHKWRIAGLKKSLKNLPEKLG